MTEQNQLKKRTHVGKDYVPPSTHVCQYCRKQNATQTVKTASGRRWKCDKCLNKRTMSGIKTL
jgi:ribosomal protein L37AE/L43A